VNIGKTIKFSSLSPEARSVVVREGLEHLEKARIICRVFHTDGNGIPRARGKRKVQRVKIGLAM
jgi:hypothetical protein